jgi:hypothetical protein
VDHEEIEALFIAGAETERRLPPAGERPARLKAQAIPYFHTQADVNGWGAERYQEERADFLSNKTTRIRTADISKWELCNELMSFVPRERDRRCLWAWAMAEAGTLKVPKLIDGERIMVRGSFSRWCAEVEHIHRNTGTARKNAAVSCVAAIFLRNTLEDIRKLQNTTLQHPPKIDDKQCIIPEPKHWIDADTKASKEAVRADRFEWSKWRNERRKELARRKAA